MRTLATFALCIGLCLILSACSDADRAKFGGNMSRHHIVQFSGGVKVGEWISTGRVQNEGSSDGYYFNDEKTGRLIRISGTVVIEKL